MSNQLHTTYILDPDRTFAELETASENKAEAQKKFRILEYHLPILKSKIKLEFIYKEKIKSTEASDRALNDPRYIDHVKSLVLAESIYTRAKDSFDNKKALKDMRITQESSARYLIKNG
jgi:hypothetical protein|tara:strand:- start:902 stop:1258 length:357 start_codon:yes stop_codon:yes gene_type:complete